MTAQTRTQTPLSVATGALPGDISVRACFAPTAALGAVDVTVGLGRGSKGRGTRVGDDDAYMVAALLRLSAHLTQYARDYSNEAATEDPTWWQRLTAADQALAPASTAAGPAPCRDCGEVPPWDACRGCPLL